jgi:small subunit ribosomal protein S1
VEPEASAPAEPEASPPAEASPSERPADSDPPATAAAGRDTSDSGLAERAAEEGVSMMELLMEEGDYMPEAFERGDVVLGTVVRKESDQITLDVGAKREGIVQEGDLAKLPPGMLSGIKVGDQIEVVVVRRPTGDGELLVSINQALSRQDWTRAKEAMDSGEILELKVTGYNRGGVLADFGALQGFIPKSHLVSLSKVPADLQPVDRFRQLVGQEIPLKVV